MSACAPDQAESEVWRHIKMNRIKLIRRLGLVVALVAVLAVAAGAPVLQAQPEGVTLSLTVPAMWENHPQCKASVTVGLTGVTNVGGYETKLTFNSASYSLSPNNISLNNYLAVNGRQSSGQDGTPFLVAPGAGHVKWGDYSWGAGAGAGAGTISAVGLDVLACGTGRMSLSETQVVDTQGNLLTLDSQATNIPTVVHLRTDINGSGAVTALDVNQVRNALNNGVVPQCGDNTYRFDVNNSGGITALDVNLVRNAVNTGATCPNP
jgi:hypothetical protein